MPLSDGSALRDARKAALLRPQTRVRSTAERAVKFAILNNGVVAYYELPRSSPFNGVPARSADFTFRLTIDGRQVEVDPHGNMSDAWLVKFGESGSEHAWRIIISDKPDNGISEFADEYWQLTIMKKRPAEDYRAGMDALLKRMKDLVLRSDQADNFSWVRGLKRSDRAA